MSRTCICGAYIMKTFFRCYAVCTYLQISLRNQIFLLPTKSFHPRVSANTRPSGIFLTECLLSAYNFPSVFRAPAVYFTHSAHPSPPQTDASASVTGASELPGASCKSRTGCVSSAKMSKRVFSLSAETVVSASTCSSTLYCA